MFPLIFARWKTGSRSIVVGSMTIGLLGGPGGALAAWQPSMDHVDAVCREQLAGAGSAPAGSIEASNAWLTYLYCARSVIAQGMAYEQGHLRVGNRRINVPPDCDTFTTINRATPGGTKIGSEIDSALALARQVNAFQVSAPQVLRSRITAAGLADRDVFRNALLEVERAVTNIGLTPEYVEELVAARQKLDDLEANCYATSGPDQRSAWLLTCSGQVKIGAAGGGPFEACRDGEFVLFPPDSVVRTASGSAHLVFPFEGDTMLSARLEQNSELSIGELRVGADDTRASLALEKGAVEADARGNAELQMTAGAGQTAPRCRLRRGAVARIAYDSMRALLTVDVRRGRVSVHTPYVSAFGDAGQQLRFVGGKKVD